MIKVLNKQSSPYPRYFLNLRPKHFPQVSVPRHSQSIPLLSVTDQASHLYKTIGKL